GITVSRSRTIGPLTKDVDADRFRPPAASGSVRCAMFTPFRPIAPVYGRSVAEHTIPHLLDPKNGPCRQAMTDVPHLWELEIASRNGTRATRGPSAPARHSCRK